VLALAVLGAGGCLHVDSQRNAPGHVDVRAPPARIEIERTERPADPGERIVVLSPGVLLARSSPVGLELSFHYGESSVSHERDHRVGGLLLPDRSLALNLGGTVSAGQFYAEVQAGTPIAALAAGYVRDRDRARSGAQSTAFLGPLYLRVRYFPDGGGQLELGFLFKAPLAISWSR
jgi:hypothetical protein